MRTDASPEGVPAQAFDDFKQGILSERSQFWPDASEGFISAGGHRARPGRQGALQPGPAGAPRRLIGKRGAERGGRS